MRSDARLRVLVSVIGDVEVGKMSLVHRFLSDDQVRRDLGEGRTHHRKRYLIELPDRDLALAMDMDISDHCQGEGPVAPDACNCLSDADGVVAVADLTRKESLNDLDGWVHAVYRLAGNVPVVFALNKADLDREARERWGRELRAAAYAFQAPSFLTSAKTGENVTAVFGRMAADIVRWKMRTQEVGDTAVRPLPTG